MSAETWKPIPGYEGLYEVSDAGRCRNIRTQHPMTPFTKGGGYISYGLCREGCAKQHYAHRLVLQAFVGPCPKGMECRHLDGCKTNNRLANLAWGTYAENMQDSVRHGVRAAFLPGAGHPYAKLDETKVQAIRTAKGTMSALSKRFGIAQSHICRIKNRQAWSHVA